MKDNTDFITNCGNIINKLHFHNFYTNDKIDMLKNILMENFNNNITSYRIDYENFNVQLQLRQKYIKNFSDNTLLLYNEIENIMNNFFSHYNNELISIIGKKDYNSLIQNSFMYYRIFRYSKTTFIINLI